MFQNSVYTYATDLRLCTLHYLNCILYCNILYISVLTVSNMFLLMVNDKCFKSEKPFVLFKMLQPPLFIDTGQIDFDLALLNLFCITLTGAGS